MSGFRSWTGREFHKRGPAAAKVVQILSAKMFSSFVVLNWRWYFSGTRGILRCDVLCDRISSSTSVTVSRVPASAAFHAVCGIWQCFFLVGCLSLVLILVLSSKMFEFQFFCFFLMNVSEHYSSSSSLWHKNLFTIVDVNFSFLF